MNYRRQLTQRAKDIFHNQYILGDLSVSIEISIMFFTVLLGFVPKAFALLSLLALFLACLSFYQDKKILLDKLSKAFLVPILIVIIILWGIYSIIVGTITFGDLVDISAYTIFPLIISLVKFKPYDVIRIIAIMPIFGIIGFNSLFRLEYASINQMDMFAAYALFVIVSANLLYFIFYWRNITPVLLVSTVLNVFLLISLIQYGVRGIILSLAVLFLFLLCKVICSLKTRYRYLIMFIFIALLIGMTLQYKPIILSVYDIVSSITEECPSFIIKMRNFVENGSGILNGRDDIYLFSLNRISENILFGHGINSLPGLSDGLYPYSHNFVLQFLLDGGLVFSFLPLMLFLMFSWYVITWNAEKKDIKLFAFILFINCIPKLLLSENIWHQNIFWFAIGYFIVLDIPLIYFAKCKLLIIKIKNKICSCFMGKRARSRRSD